MVSTLEIVMSASSLQTLLVPSRAGSSSSSHESNSMEMEALHPLPLSHEKVRALLEMPYDQLMSTESKKQADWKIITEDGAFWEVYLDKHWGCTWVASRGKRRPILMPAIAADLFAKDRILSQLEEKQGRFREIFQTQAGDLARALGKPSEETRAWVMGERQVQRVIARLWTYRHLPGHNTLEGTFIALLAKLYRDKVCLGRVILSTIEDLQTRSKARYFPPAILQVLVHLSIQSHGLGKEGAELAQDCYAAMVKIVSGKERPRKLGYHRTVRALAELALNQDMVDQKVKVWVLNRMLRLVEPEGVYLYSASKHDFSTLSRLALEQGKLYPSQVISRFRCLSNCLPSNAMVQHQFYECLLPDAVRALGAMACDQRLPDHLVITCYRILAEVRIQAFDGYAACEAMRAQRLIRSARGLRCDIRGRAERRVLGCWYSCDGKGRLTEESRK